MLGGVFVLLLLLLLFLWREIWWEIWWVWVGGALWLCFAFFVVGERVWGIELDGKYVQCPMYNSE